MAQIPECAAALISGPRQDLGVAEVADLAGRPNITVLVRPFDSGLHRGVAGPFTVLEFTDEPAVALVANQTGVSRLDDADELLAVRVALADVLAGALITRLAEDVNAD